MVYGYDQAQLFPVQSLYDTGMINMYVNAVQREYERGLADQKEFISKYGDFTSPFANDVESWNKATLGRIQKAMEDLQKLGIDPVRSQEGRAYMSRVMASTPYADLANLKMSAENGRKYMQAVDELKKAGLYNEDYIKYLYGDKYDPRTWDTVTNGAAWDLTSAVPYQDIKTATDNWFKGMQDTLLEEKELSDVYGLERPQYEAVVNRNLDDFLRTDLGKYMLHLHDDDEEALKKTIVDARQGEFHRVEKENHERTAKYEAKQRRIAASTSASRNSGGGKGNQTKTYSYTTAYRNQAIGNQENWVMSRMFDENENVLPQYQKDYEELKSYSENGDMNSYTDKLFEIAANMSRNVSSINDLPHFKDSELGFLSRFPHDDTSEGAEKGSVTVNAEDLYTKDDLVNMSRGNTNRVPMTSWTGNYNVVRKGNGNVYVAYDPNDGTFHGYAEVKISGSNATYYVDEGSIEISDLVNDNGIDEQYGNLSKTKYEYK